MKDNIYTTKLIDIILPAKLVKSLGQETPETNKDAKSDDQIKE
jgi:hypothetical protein